MQFRQVSSIHKHKKWLIQAIFLLNSPPCTDEPLCSSLPFPLPSRRSAQSQGQVMKPQHFEMFQLLLRENDRQHR